MSRALEDRIRINVPSETAPLRTVVMRLAGPMSAAAVWGYVRSGGIDRALWHQMRRNRWGFYDHVKVRRQQEALISLLRAHGVAVLLADGVRGCITQHFVRDVGFAIGDTFFLAVPRRRYRQRELEGLRRLLPRFSKVVRLDRGSIEGGDVMVDERFVLVGLSEETTPEGVDGLREKLEGSGVEREVITITFAHRGAIHLDTRFNIAAPGIGLVHRPSIARRSLRWLEDHFDLLPVSEREAARVEINTLTLAPDKVILRECSRRLAERLAAKGVEPIFVDYSAVAVLPGSFRCTTLPLARGGIAASTRGTPER